MKPKKIILIITALSIAGYASYKYMYSSNADLLIKYGESLSSECQEDAINNIMENRKNQAKELNDIIGDIHKLSLARSSGCVNGKEVVSTNIIINENSLPQLVASLAKSNATVYQNFNETIANKVESLISILQPIKSYCSKEFPSSAEIKKIQGYLSIEMNKQIKI